MKKLFIAVLAASLLLSEASFLSQPIALAAAQATQEAPQPSTVRPPSRAQRRSYQRETQTRRRSHISKKEVAMMAAIAGTSMGIGALAGGAKGLAIGAIVGGWGAYAGHRLWRWLK